VSGAEEVAKNLSRAEKWCLEKGGARYGTKIEAWRKLKAMGLAYAYDHGATKRTGRWTWRLTDAGQALRRHLSQPDTQRGTEGR
jgi:hypothetical protein